MWGLGSSTLDKAATVKLTRTLAIIPITLALSYIVGKKEEAKENLGINDKEGFSLKRAFPTFIGFFIIASIITTIATIFGADPSIFVPLKEISKFLIVMAMPGPCLACSNGALEMASQKNPFHQQQKAA